MSFNPDTRICLSFDDVLLVPQYSDIESRHTIDIGATDWDGFPIEVAEATLKLPIFASPMDTVIDSKTAVILANRGVTPIIHRYCSPEDQLDIYQEVVSNLCPESTPVGVAIGTGEMCLNNAVDLYESGCRLFCVDAAHGHHHMSVRVVSYLKHLYPDIFLIAGNVATRDGFEALADAGADAVRVGIGGGSVCSTRIVTGHGIPTFQSIIDCADTDRSCYIIADGGIRNTGDIVKAYAAGADFVMLGSMLACKSESPGEIKVINDITHKNYRGMASTSAQMSWRGRVSVSEGVDSWRPVVENLDGAIDRIVAGIRSGLSYTGCSSIADFYAASEFVRVSPAAVKENAPHGPGAIREAQIG